MNHVRHSVTIISTMLAFVFAFVVGAPAAFAVRVAPPGSSSTAAGSAAPSATSGTAGMPGWEIVVIALAAALVAAAVTAVVMRLRFRAALRPAVA